MEDCPLPARSAEDVMQIYFLRILGRRLHRPWPCVSNWGLEMAPHVGCHLSETAKPQFWSP